VSERRTALILEDDAHRIAKFNAVLGGGLGLAPHLWCSAVRFIEQVGSWLPKAAVISLDHDLYTDEPDDPGDGLMVAKWLAERPPACPVIIHSSNGPRVRMMQGEFELGGWDCRIVGPYGDDWVERDWAMTVRECVG